MFLGIILANPLDVMYRPFRFELMYSFYHNLIAPFGLVRFKEFFLGDILTSMVRPLIDIYFTACFFGQDEWMSSASSSVCKPSNMAILIVSLIPFHIRFWQCINRYYYTQMWFPHLVNAGKYMSTIVLIVVSYYRNTYRAYD